LKQPDTEELCRRCGKESETIQHITAAWEQLAPTEYVKRHDGVAKIIRQKLAEAAELIDDKSPYYKYTLANVLENENSLYPQAKSPPYVLNRRLNGCRSQSGRLGEWMNLLYLQSFELRTV
jgi:ribosomal protein L37E